jgi:hypothetical protein
MSQMKDGKKPRILGKYGQRAASWARKVWFVRTWVGGCHLLAVYF